MSSLTDWGCDEVPVVWFVVPRQTLCGGRLSGMRWDIPATEVAHCTAAPHGQTIGGVVF